MLLDLVRPLSVLRGGLGLLVGALRLPLPVLDLVRLRPLIIGLVILVIDDQDGVAVLLVLPSGVLALLLLLSSIITRCDVYNLLAAALQASVVHLVLLILITIVHLLLVIVFIVVHLSIHVEPFVLLVIVVIVHVHIRVELLPTIVFIVWECVGSHACLLLLGGAWIARLHNNFLNFLVYKLVLKMGVHAAACCSRCPLDLTRLWLPWSSSVALWARFGRALGGSLLLLGHWLVNDLLECVFVVVVCLVHFLLLDLNIDVKFEFF